MFVVGALIVLKITAPCPPPPPPPCDDTSVTLPPDPPFDDMVNVLVAAIFHVLTLSIRVPPAPPPPAPSLPTSAAVCPFALIRNDEPVPVVFISFAEMITMPPPLPPAEL